MNNKKSLLIKILFISTVVTVAFVMVFCFIFTKDKNDLDKNIVANNEEELLEQVSTLCMGFADEVSVEMNISNFNLDNFCKKLQDKINDKNPCLSINIRSFKIDRISGNNYKFSFQYHMSEIKYKLVNFEAKYIASKLNGLTNYEKIKAIHDYLCEISTYDAVATNDAFDILYLHHGSCMGYSMSFSLIMQECGIPCKVATSTNHAWNAVQVDGKWYNIDVTWDDATDKISYDFFLKGNEEFISHSKNPICESESYNADLNYKFKISNNRRNLIVAFLISFIAVVVIVIKRIKRHT